MKPTVVLVYVYSSHIEHQALFWVLGSLQEQTEVPALMEVMFCHSHR